MGLPNRTSCHQSRLLYINKPFAVDFNKGLLRNSEELFVNYLLNLAFSFYVRNLTEKCSYPGKRQVIECRKFEIECWQNVKLELVETLRDQYFYIILEFKEIPILKLRVLRFDPVLVVKLGEKFRTTKMYRVYFSPNKEAGQTHHEPIRLFISCAKVQHVSVECVDS
jgi:hypothetical protein